MNVGTELCSLFTVDSPRDPLDVAVAAKQLTLAITVVDPSGVATRERVQATTDGGNVYAVGTDGVSTSCLLSSSPQSGAL